MTQYTTIEFRREARFEERYMELTGANTLDTLIFFNNTEWYKTPEGKYVKRSVLREQRAAWCLKYLDEYNHNGEMKETRYRCNEHTACPFCRGLRVEEEKQILAQEEQLCYIETNEDNEEALKKACKRAKGKFRRYPRINGVISIVVTKQIKGAKPITHEEVAAQLDTWVREIDTLNGKKISGTLRAPVVPEVEEEGDGEGEPEEKGEIRVTHAITPIETCSKRERIEAYQIAWKDVKDEPVSSFEQLEAANLKFMKSYINALGSMNPDYVVDTYVTVRKVTTKNLDAWNDWLSSYSVFHKDSNTEKADSKQAVSKDSEETMYEELLELV